MTTIKKLYSRLTSKLEAAAPAKDKKKTSAQQGKKLEPKSTDTLEVAPVKLSPEAHLARSIRYVHGTNSALLPMLGRTDLCMVPTGELLDQGVAPMAGELFNGGLRADGVNARRLSLAPATHWGFRAAVNYATKPPSESDFVCKNREQVEENGRLALKDHFPVQWALFAGVGGLRLSQMGALGDSSDTLSRCAEHLSAYMSSASWQALEAVENFVNDRAYEPPAGQTESAYRAARRQEGEFGTYVFSKERAFDRGDLRTYLNSKAEGGYSLLLDTIQAKSNHAEMYAAGLPQFRACLDAYMTQARRAHATLANLSDPPYKMGTQDRSLAFSNGFGMVLGSTRDLPDGRPGASGGVPEVSFAGPLRLGRDLDVILTEDEHMQPVRDFLQEHRLTDDVQVLSYDTYYRALEEAP